MAYTDDVFENKNERNDFFIAIGVILLFLFFITRYLGCSNEQLASELNDIEPAAVEAVAVDTDGDGIVDDLDKCPEIAGIADNDGCPADKDGDGIADSEDACPNYKGTIKNNGCPADTDGDGVHDGIDKCPKVDGPRANKGCPFDRDGDGIADAQDRCPDVAGIAANGGCPKVKMDAVDVATLEEAMKSVEFQTGKGTLKASSYGVLNKIASMMQKYPRYKLNISGHTDNVTGADGPAGNLRLSKERAKACFDYLVSKGGIKPGRMSHNGYGQRKPRASNKTPEGRQKNRRVEFELNY